MKGILQCTISFFLFLFTVLFLAGCGTETEVGDSGRSDQPPIVSKFDLKSSVPSTPSSTLPPPKRVWQKLVPLLTRVEILFALERVDSLRVRMDGMTNLPNGTKLMTSIKETNAIYAHSAKATVQSDGSFTATFELVGDGQYRAEVLMPILLVQPESLQQILGIDGENVKGPLREHAKAGVVVRRHADVLIRNGTIEGGDDVLLPTTDASTSSSPVEQEWPSGMPDKELE